MNSTVLQGAQDRFAEYFSRNFIVVVLGITINFINGIFVFTFFRSSTFYNDPRYILYIHLVINDMLMVFMTVVLFVMAYAWQNVPVPFCILLLIIGSTTHKNTPLTLAGMAIERYIAICKPLHHSQICTVRRTYILISLIWGVGVRPALTDLVVFSIVLPISIFTKGALCSSANLYSTPYHIVISKCTHGVYTSAVWLILLFTYVRVLDTAKRAKSDKTAKKAQSTIMLHGIQLLLCMLSYITPLIDRIYLPLIPSEQKKIAFFNYLLTNMAPRLLSPLIYGVRDQHLYKHVKGLFTCRIFIVKVKATK